MNLPTPLLAQATGVVLTADLSVSWPILVVLSFILLAWGEARVHISGLREWRREAEVKIAAQGAQIAAMEVRESRTVARLDHLSAQLSTMDTKLDRLLGQGRGVA